MKNILLRAATLPRLATLTQRGLKIFSNGVSKNKDHFYDFNTKYQQRNITIIKKHQQNEMHHFINHHPTQTCLDGQQSRV